MRSVLLTGSEGTIGSVLRGKSLTDRQIKPALIAPITRVDERPARGSKEAAPLGKQYNRLALTDRTNSFRLSDLSDSREVKRLLIDSDVVIHAAWANESILDPESHDPENLERVKRLLMALTELGDAALGKTVILLSSVNAHVPQDWRQRREQDNLIPASEAPAQPHHHNRYGRPGPGYSSYGQTKLEVEALAKQFADRAGLDIVVPRIGAVNLGDQLASEYPTYQQITADPAKGRFFDSAPNGWEDATFLSHADMIANTQRYVDAPAVPGRFVLENWVSPDNPNRVHVVGE